MVHTEKKSHGITDPADVPGSFYNAKLFGNSNGNIDTSDFSTATPELLAFDNEVNTDLHQTGSANDCYSGNLSRSRPATVGLKDNDRIWRLPGQPPVQFDQYAGYVTVDASKEIALFYYFVVAEKSKNDSLPLLLWLNGGPGRSSLAYGAMQELGPSESIVMGRRCTETNFHGITDHLTIYTAANVLFLESPVGIGFSYSNTWTNYTANEDGKTATLNYKFLMNWLNRFPEYRGQDFYIAGESYAGHYVPQLAHHILARNRGRPTITASSTSKES
ncbi:hypothetical protein CRG98_016633 [Punica granatum]|uniref:Carboxypeptidase n=1 Tax=Punica granatum TaxID=22663 RepID=A0A2I0K368_PUNGR|nr:hypothetical protein CRG98_016633 [Punica granatum]